jgi:hypothetical protein
VKIALIIGAALSALATPAFAQNMPVSTFLEKADALKAKGIMAMLSSDVGVLKAEVQAAALSYRKERKASEAAGRKPEVCPPEKGSLNTDELIATFRTIPAEARPRTTVKQAWIGFMKRKYPCPK